MVNEDGHSSVWRSAGVPPVQRSFVGSADNSPYEDVSC